jgi:hypothetical protein
MHHMALYLGSVPAGVMKRMVNQEAEIRFKLQQLRIEHRDLDEVINRLTADMTIDQLQLRRLKKRKLLLKDMIARLENDLIPDDIA